MNIDTQLLDELTAQAQSSPSFRMHYDLRNSSEDLSQRMLNAIMMRPNGCKALSEENFPTYRRLFKALSGAFLAVLLCSF